MGMRRGGKPKNMWLQRDFENTAKKNVCQLALLQTEGELCFSGTELACQP